MTPFANGKIVAAKSTFAVVARQTALGSSGRVMIEWFRCGNLPALWQARSYLMTLIAGNPIVFCMCEADAKRRRGLWCARIATQLMTSAA